MPLVRIDLSKGKSAAFRKAVSEGAQAVLIETFKVPQDDLFQIISEHDPQTGIVHAPSYLGINYSGGLTLIQLTVTFGNGVAQYA